MLLIDNDGASEPPTVGHLPKRKAKATMSKVAATAAAAAAARAATLEARYVPPPTPPVGYPGGGAAHGATKARAGETLFSFINRGGMGRHAVCVDKAEQLIVDTPDWPAARVASLDWLRVGADPLMRSGFKLVTIESATGLAYAGSAVTAEYLVGGAGSSAAADPTIAFKKLTAKHIGTRAD